MQKFAGKPIGKLIGYISNKMPPGNPGSLGTPAYTGDRSVSFSAEWRASRSRGTACRPRRCARAAWPWSWRGTEVRPEIFASLGNSENRCPVRIWNDTAGTLALSRSQPTLSGSDRSGLTASLAKSALRENPRILDLASATHPVAVAIHTMKKEIPRMFPGAGTNVPR